MFVSYDSITFGLRIRDIRKSLRLSQQEVSEKAGINCDTLRRIEHGSVIPKFETLEVLSHFYKTNLLQILDTCKASNILMTLYDDLDYVIIKGDLETLNTLHLQMTTFSENENQRVEPMEVQQFTAFLEALRLSYQDTQAGKTEAISRLYRLIFVNHLNFSLDNLTSKYFTHFEYKVLLVLAVTLAETKSLIESSTLLWFLRDYMPVSRYSRQTEKQMHLKILINLAYNMHLQDHHLRARALSDEGIQFCHEHDMLYGLYFLYYRKAIANYHLEKDYMKYFQLAFQTLAIQGLDDLAEHYKQTLVETYNIHT